MSDGPQYPTYPGDDSTSQGAPGPPPGYGQPPPGYGQPPPGYGQPPPGYGQPPPGYGQPHRPTPAGAVVGMILGIVSIVFCYLGALIGPAAIIVSVMAGKDIASKPPGTVAGKGMATAGLVTGIIGTVIWVGVDVLVVLAVVNDW